MRGICFRNEGHYLRDYHISQRDIYLKRKDISGNWKTLYCLPRYIQKLYYLSFYRVYLDYIFNSTWHLLQVLFVFVFQNLFFFFFLSIGKVELMIYGGNWLDTCTFILLKLPLQSCVSSVLIYYILCLVNIANLNFMQDIINFLANWPSFFALLL